MPKTYIFHLAKNPEIEVPIELITIDDCKKMIGKTYYLVHKNYEPSGFVWSWIRFIQKMIVRS